MKLKYLDTNNIHKEENETPLRRKYRQYIETYKTNLGIYISNKEQLENIYIPKIRKQKFLKKCFLVSVFELLSVTIILTFIEYTTTNLYQSALTIFAIGLIICLLFYILYISSKNKIKKLSYQKELEINKYYNKYMVPGENCLEQAGNLVFDLLIEDEYHDSLNKVKDNESKEEYLKFYNDLKKYQINKISNELGDIGTLDNLDYHLLTGYYNNLYDEKKSSNIDHNYRKQLAEYKSNVYNNKYNADQEIDSIINLIIEEQHGIALKTVKYNATEAEYIEFYDSLKIYIIDKISKELCCSKDELNYNIIKKYYDNKKKKDKLIK